MAARFAAYSRLSFAFATRLIATALTSSLIPSSSRNLSKVEPLWLAGLRFFFVFIAFRLITLPDMVHHERGQHDASALAYAKNVRCVPQLAGKRRGEPRLAKSGGKPPHSLKRRGSVLRIGAFIRAIAGCALTYVGARPTIAARERR